MAIYCTQLKETTNTKNKKFYYVSICGVWRRIGKKEYFERQETKIRENCFYTVIDSKTGNVQQFKTVYFSVDDKR